MKWSFALAAGLVVLSAGPARTESLQQCTGPFRPCAIELLATCSTDPDGKQRMTFTDERGNWMRFERCVGRIFEQHGQPNPFKTGANPATAGRQVSSGVLTVPYTEMLYPHNYGKD